MSRRKTEFFDSAILNKLTYNHYLQILTELAISSFEWHNLPESVDSRFLELALFYKAQAVFFNDEVLGYLCLQCTTGAGFNVYNIPVERRAYASNGYNRILDDKNSVLIYNNMLRTSSDNTILMFANRLWDLDRTIDINSKSQKTPFILTSTPQQRLTILNLYKEYTGNAPVIYGDKNIDLQSLQCIPTQAPYVGDKLYSLKVNLWNEALTYLGITNVSINKRERLSTDEVNRSLGGTIACRQSRLKARKQACEKINEMFGLNIDVSFNENDIKAILNIDGIGGDDNE